MIAAIVNADDLGFAAAINEGILLAHREGCLTSASLSVAGPLAEEAAAASLDHPELGIGLHLTLVSERSLSPPQAIPSLVDSQGRFPPNVFAFARRWLAGVIRRRDVRHEVRAQLERAKELGVSLTHLDADEHVHVLPGVLEVVLEEMQRAGLWRLRIPFEDKTLEPGQWKRRMWRSGVNLMARRAAKLAREAGLVTTDHYLGFLGSGHIDIESLLMRIDSLQEGVTELVFHPAAGHEPPRPEFASWGYQWDVELEALLDPRARRAFEQKGIVLMNYGQLPINGVSASS